MKWLLIIILVSPVEDADYDTTLSFAAESECLAAARAFVERHPDFELREKAGNLLLRSYVECIPQYPD